MICTNRTLNNRALVGSQRPYQVRQPCTLYIVNVILRVV